MTLLVIILCVGISYFLFWITNLNRKAQIYQNCFIKHQETLLRKYKQSIYIDDYGNVQHDRWYNERDYFIENVLAREFPNGLDDFNIDAVADMIDNQVKELLSTSKSKVETAQEFDEFMTPLDFEKYCLNQLLKNGWQGNTTKATGDQGIDIIANIGSKRAVFQCKLYSKPVGNSAVQEVAAGKGFEEAQLAVVISNQTYTKSARQLAQSLDVYLIHFEQISEFTRSVIS